MGSRSNKSMPKVAGSESVTTSVLPTVKHNMQQCEDITTSMVTGSATPSTATPTSRTPVAAGSFSAVPTFLTPRGIQTSSADQISVLKLIEDNPELHNLVAT